MSDKTDKIILSVKLASGKFDASISVPTNYKINTVDSIVEGWLGMIHAALEESKSKDTP